MTDVSPLWCANDEPHAEHWANTNRQGNYCSGRPSPVLPDSTLREHLMSVLNIAGAYCGGCDYENGYEGEYGCDDCASCLAGYADALAPLFAVVSAEAEKRGKRQGWDAGVADVAKHLDDDAWLFNAHAGGMAVKLAAAVFRDHPPVNPYIPEPEKGQK